MILRLVAGFVFIPHFSFGWSRFGRDTRQMLLEGAAAKSSQC
jgi:hypothetical protein